jgi:hypothetical protein
MGGIGVVFPIPAAARAPLLAFAALACLLIDTGLIPLPTVRRQVNEDWLGRYRGWAYGAGFGLQLGAGVVTIVTSAAVYLTLVGEFLVGSEVTGAMIGAAFGLVRAAPLMAPGRARSHEQLVTRHRRLVALAPAGKQLTLAMTAGAAGALIFLSIWSRP